MNEISSFITGNVPLKFEKDLYSYEVINIKLSLIIFNDIHIRPIWLNLKEKLAIKKNSNININ